MALKTEQLNYFAKIIEDNTGIVYRDTNFFQLESRLEAIAKSMGLSDLEELWAKTQLGVDEALKQILLDTATNNETSFFRDKNVFSAIEKYCIPKMKEQRPGAISYNIWTAACSTGQEPYSLSMILAEKTAKENGSNVSIWATDISERVLNYSKAGVYSTLETQRGLPPGYLAKYFTKTEQEAWALKAEIKSRVRFSKLNFLDSWPLSFGPFDIILCRNVLIYQNNENKKKIIEKAVSKLHPRGFFILGGAESMIGLSDEFEQISTDGAVVYQKKA